MIIEPTGEKVWRYRRVIMLGIALAWFRVMRQRGAVVAPLPADLKISQARTNGESGKGPRHNGKRSL